MATHLQTNETKRSFDGFLGVLVEHDRKALIRTGLLISRFPDFDRLYSDGRLLVSERS